MDATFRDLITTVDEAQEAGVVGEARHRAPKTVKAKTSEYEPNKCLSVRVPYVRVVRDPMPAAVASTRA